MRIAPPEDKIKIVESFNETKCIPSTFKVLGVGECIGTQTIPRAELQAVLAIAECQVFCEIGTDSQYVVDLAAKLQKIQDVSAFHKSNNFDLLLPFWRLLKDNTLKIYKIQAHSYSINDDPHQCFNKLGNMAADLAAKTARMRYESRQTVTLADDNAAKLLPRYFNLLYDLHVARDRHLTLNEQKFHQPAGHRNSTQWLGELQGWDCGTTDTSFCTGKRGSTAWYMSLGNGIQYADTTVVTTSTFSWADTGKWSRSFLVWDDGRLPYFFTNWGGNQRGWTPESHSNREDWEQTTATSNSGCRSTVSKELSLRCAELWASQFCRSDEDFARRLRCWGYEILRLVCRHVLACLGQSQTMQLLYRHFAALGGDETKQGGPWIPEQSPIFQQQPTGSDELDLQSAWLERHRRYQRRKSTKR